MALEICIGLLGYTYEPKAWTLETIKHRLIRARNNVSIFFTVGTLAEFDDIQCQEINRSIIIYTGKGLRRYILVDNWSSCSWK